MAHIDLQKRFLSCLEEKIGPRKLIPFLQENLNIGKSAAYNRLRGKTVMAANEIAILSDLLNISIDKLLARTNNKVEFDLPSMRQNPKTIKEFFFEIQSYMEQMAKYDSSHIRYATNEVPLFQYMFSPEVIAFKLFIWARSIWNWDAVQNQKFSCQKYIQEFNLPNKTDKLLDLYMQIDSTEYWNTNILNNTISQIKYYESSGVFQSRSDIDKIYNGLELTLRHAEQMAQKGKKSYRKNSKFKSNGSSFNLYCNHFIYTNNTILTTSPFNNSVFATFDSPNFMKSDSESLIDYTVNWFEAIRKRSSNIAQESEKERKKFFEILYKQIKSAKTVS